MKSGKIAKIENPKTARQERLDKALRENLRKRKIQQRARSQPSKTDKAALGTSEHKGGEAENGQS